MRPTGDDPLLHRLVAQRYRLIAKLGEGGMGQVYLARHVVIDRLSAMKVLRDEMSGLADVRERFMREAQAVNRINHPNIVEITDYGESDGLVYLVMEYIPGDPLPSLMKNGPLPWRRAAHIARQIASALGRAHQMGVIHRDLKPSNVLVESRRDGDRVKLTDFGVAKIADTVSLTETDMALGTPGYVAPESLGWGFVDPRTDLFSLGVLLYECVTDRMPFDIRLGPAMFGHPPPPMTDVDPTIAPFFEEVVQTLLQFDPDDRPRDGFETIDLLDRALHLGSVGNEPAAYQETLQFVGIDQLPHAAGGALEDLAHFSTTRVEQIAPKCTAALARITASARDAHPLPAPVEVAVRRATESVATLQRLAGMVHADGEEVESARARGNALMSQLGRRLDELARQRSKKLGWAGTIAERREHVRGERISGVHPVSAVDAMVWEHAALTHEEERVRERVDALSAEMSRVQEQVAREGERTEREAQTASAKLEGHIAALRAMSMEAWQSLEAAATHLGLRMER